MVNGSEWSAGRATCGGLCSQRKWGRVKKQHAVLANNLARDRTRTAADTELELARMLPHEHVCQGGTTA